MLIRHLDPEKFFHAYGVDIQLLYPWEGTVVPPFGAAWAVIPPGGATKHHNHQENETFFVARGRGRYTVGEEAMEVGPGHVIYHRPFEKHILQNLSETEELLFLTVWWEDKNLWPEPPATAAGASRRLLVTAAPPTPNGDLHLGHISGPYLAADVLTRAQRLRGVDAYFACGSDDNSEYVKSKGAQLGVSPEAAAERFVASIERSLGLAGIGLEVFVHANESPHHRRLVSEFFLELHRKGKLEERETLAPHCKETGRYLFEPWIGGKCPHCGSGVVGNTCEDCGRVNDALVLEPRSMLTGGAVEMRPVRRFVFPLSQYGSFLESYWRRTSMRPHLRGFCEKLLADGLPDVAVTHLTDWGIPVPLPGYESQRLYVWLEMAPRYFSYAQHVVEKLGREGDWRHFWQSPEAEVVQCFGFDNSFYYAAFLPALFHAFDPEVRLPTGFITNEFYRLEGLKFSTSRQHAIWVNEFLTGVPADVVRFYLSYVAPETEGTNFSLPDFLATVERELVNGWQGWLGLLAARVEGEYGGEVPATGDWTAEHQHFHGQLERIVAEAEQAYAEASFSPQEMTRLLSELVRLARRFGMAEEHWKGVPERSQERRTGVALELLAAKLLAILASPILPEFAASLWRNLGFGEELTLGSWESGKPEWVPEGQQVSGLAGPYYPAPTSLLELASARAGKFTR